MNKFTLCAFADEAGDDIDTQINALKDNKIKYLELRGIGGQNVSQLTICQATELRKHLDSEHIKVWSIGSPLGKINITDDFMTHLDLFLHTLEIAHITGASCLRLFSFYIPLEDNARLKYRDIVLEHLSCFCNAAKGSEVTLCHENEKGIYGDTAEMCLDIHKQISGLKAVFDPANFVQCGQDAMESWNLLAPYVHYIHIKDALADGTVVPAGHGHGHIKEILGKYQGKMLTLEPHLSVFNGLDKLEHGSKSVVGANIYENQRAAFDSAARELYRLI